MIGRSNILPGRVRQPISVYCKRFQYDNGSTSYDVRPLYFTALAIIIACCAGSNQTEQMECNNQKYIQGKYTQPKASPMQWPE